MHRPSSEAERARPAQGRHPLHHIKPRPSAWTLAGSFSEACQDRFAEQRHGKVQEVRTRLAHNGETLSIRLSWDHPQKDERLAC